MKYPTLATSAFALAIFFSPQIASATDILGGDSNPSGYAQPYKPDFNPSGLYLNGHLGSGWIDRSKDGSVHGQKTREVENPDDAEGAPETITESIFTDLLKFSDDEDDINPLMYGGGLSYLYKIPHSRFGLELGVEGTFYGDNRSDVSFDAAPVVTQSLDDFVYGYPDVGDDQGYSQAGIFSFERNHDIDLLLKGHYFVKPNLSLFFGGGPSWASATGSGSHASNYHPVLGDAAAGVLDNSFKKDSDALGFAVVGGANWWIDDNVALGVGAYYKRHDFDFSDGSTATAEIGDTYTYNAKDILDVEDEIWGARAELKIKLR